MLDSLRHWAGAFVRHRMRRSASKFEKAAVDGQKAQVRVLRRIMRLNAGSDFAIRHGLNDVRSVEEFRRRLPITSYEFYKPDIELMKAGRQQALLGPKNRLLMFALSSGTTADAKFIPITRQFLHDYRRGWKIWSIRAFDYRPDLFRRRILQLTSDYEQFRTPGGTPCGNISGLVTAMQNSLVRLMYTVHPAVAKIRDAEAKYYTTLRLALADRNVGAAMTANPSTLVHLAQLADLHRERLLRDIANGTLDDEFPVPGPVRAAIAHRIRPRDTQRSAELAEIIERTGRLNLREAWPHLGMMAVWTGGSAGAYLPALRRHFGDVPVRDHGLSASEGRMTIPLADGRSPGLLDVTSHFFEFIPQSEHGRPEPTVLQGHELREGESYFILLTTSSGLYRYDIFDLVRCTGFYGSTPLLEFLNKGSHISNVTGEKLAEAQVSQAVPECGERMNVCMEAFSVVPVWGDPPAYRLLIERQCVTAPAAADRLATLVDIRLQELNCEYQEKRLTRRLGPLTCELLPNGTWQRFARSRQARLGGSVEQYKHPSLIPQLDFFERFCNDFVIPFADVDPRPTTPRRHLSPQAVRGEQRV